jgi:hypothetical protein
MSQVYQWIYRFVGLPISSAVTVWDSHGAVAGTGTTDEFGVLEVELADGRYFATNAAGTKVVEPSTRTEPGTASGVQGSSSMVYSASTNGVAFDGTDQTTAVQALINKATAAGASEVHFDGLARCDGQLTIPWTTVGNQIRQTPLRLTGTVATAGGQTMGGNPYPSGGLDLRYAGVSRTSCGTTRGTWFVTDANAVSGDRGQIVLGPGVRDRTFVVAVQPGVGYTVDRSLRATGTVTLTLTGGRLQAFGIGLLEIQNMQFQSGGTSSAPFVLTTGTTVKAYDSVFLGSKSSPNCDEDPFVCGGPGQGVALTADLTAATPYTALTVSPLPVALMTGMNIYLNNKGINELSVHTTSAVAAGATSIPVSSFTPAVTYPANGVVMFEGGQVQADPHAWDTPAGLFQGYGSRIERNHFERCRRIKIGGFASDISIHKNVWIHDCASNLSVTPSTLTSALTAGTPYTSLAVTALAADVQIGDTVQAGVGVGAVVSTATADAAAGATSITIASVTPVTTQAIGAKAFNTTVGIGAHVESYATRDSVNVVDIQSNRFEFAAGYSYTTILSDLSQQGLIAANQQQDSNSTNIALHRFGPTASSNTVITGLRASSTAPFLDDQSATTSAAVKQTVLATGGSVPSQFPLGIAAAGSRSKFVPDDGTVASYTPALVDNAGNGWSDSIGGTGGSLQRISSYTPAGGSSLTVSTLITAGSGATTTLDLPGTSNTYFRNLGGHLFIQAKAGNKVNIGDPTYTANIYASNGVLAHNHTVAIGPVTTVAAAGSSTSVSITGKDTAHTVSLTTAAGLGAGAAAAAVTYGQSWTAVAPNAVPRFGVTAKNLATVQAQPFVVSDSVTGYSVAFGNPPAGAVAMIVDVLVLGSPN